MYKSKDHLIEFIILCGFNFYSKFEVKLLQRSSDKMSRKTFAIFIFRIINDFSIAINIFDFQEASNVPTFINTH